MQRAQQALRAERAATAVLAGIWLGHKPGSSLGGIYMQRLCHKPTPGRCTAIVGDSCQQLTVVLRCHS